MHWYICVLFKFIAVLSSGFAAVSAAARGFLAPVTSCCKGALTFDKVCHVKDKLTGQRSEPNEKERIFKGVPASVCWDIENCRELFGCGNDQLEARVFEECALAKQVDLFCAV